MTQLTPAQYCNNDYCNHQTGPLRGNSKAGHDRISRCDNQGSHGREEVLIAASTHHPGESRDEKKPARSSQPDMQA